MPLINAHVDVFSEASGQNFDMGLHIHPYFVYASRKCSGESKAQAMHLRRLA